MSAVLSAIASNFTFGIQIEKKSMYRLAVNVGAVIINCVLNLLLIPEYGIVGAATATVVTYLILTAISMAISQNLYFVPYRWIRVIAGWALIACVSVAATTFDTAPSPENIALKMAVLLCSLLALSKIFDIDFRQILHLRNLGQSKPAPARDDSNA
jgi:O-antigen/teichoic acid export membrane protein